MLIIGLFITPLFSQINPQNATYLINGNQAVNFQVNGYLDGKNSLKRHRYACIGLPEYAYVSNFTSLDSLIVQNKDTSVIQNLMVITNNDNNYYRFDSISKYAISSNAANDIDSIWDVYQFVADRHYYYFKPENCVREPYEVTKHFGTYGYGNCGTIGNCANVIGHAVSGKGQRWWGINGGSHVVSELKFKDKWRFVDSDEYELFLDVDNKTPISLGDLYEDPYLGFRTKILGPTLAYSYSNSRDFVNRLYNTSNHYTWNTDSANYIGILFQGGKDSINKQPLGFTLYPGEKLTFRSEKSDTFYHHMLSTPCLSTTSVGYYPDSSNLFPMIKNARIELALMNPQIPFSKKVNSFQNLQVSLLDQSIEPVGNSGHFILNRQSSLPIVNGHIHLTYACQSNSDIIQIMASKDSINWVLIFTSKPSSYKDTTISLYTFFDPKIKVACQRFFIKTNLESASGNHQCILQNFELQYTVQLSKFLFPTLQKGVNNIQFQSEETPSFKAEATLFWEENYNNHPPTPPNFCIYPLDNDTVQNTNITFKWEQIWKDGENDSIKEWQFLLSEFPDFRHPLSNNFNQYSGGAAQFHISKSWNAFNGLKVYPVFYNHKNTYYWKVRNMDQKGAWSEWSNTWKFTVTCPMHPVNVHFETTPNDTIYQLVWTPQLNGIPASSYNVYASSSTSLPVDSLFKINQLTDQSIVINQSQAKSFRVNAVDNLGNPSTPSRIAYMPIKNQLVYGDIYDLSTMINSLQKPFSAYPGLERNYFVQIDTNYFVQIGPYQIKSKKAGRSMVNICYTKEDLIDTIYRKQIDCTILKAELLVQAKDTSDEYGNLPIFNAINYVGFKNNDDASSFLTLPQLSSSANVNSPVGTYPILISGGSHPNYHLTYQNGVYHVLPAPLQIKAKDTSVSYGDVPTLHGVDYIGFKNGEDSSVLNSLPVLHHSTTLLSNVGTYPIIVDSADATNYSIQYLNGSLHITKAPLQITAKDTSIEYGEMPVLNGVKYAGFKNGEDESVLTNGPTQTTTANNQSDIGNYPIQAQGATALNYQFNYIDGQLQVLKAPLSIIAKDTFSIYGSPAILNGFQMIGWKQFDNSTVLSKMPEIMTDALPTFHVGQYPIYFKDTMISALNYKIHWQKGKLDIRKKDLNCIIQNHSRLFEEPNPLFDYQWQGFVNGDTEAQLDSIPERVCLANQYSLAGEYPITAQSVQNKDYQVNIQSGKLSILPILGRIQLKLDSIETSGIRLFSQIHSSGGEINELGLEWILMNEHPNLQQNIAYHLLDSVKKYASFDYNEVLPYIPNKVYSVRAYLTNSAGTIYSETVHCSTFEPLTYFAVPNPSNGFFAIILPNTDQQVVMKLFDMNGKILLESPLNDFYNPIQTNLSSGLYLIKLFSNGQKISECKHQISR